MPNGKHHDHPVTDTVVHGLHPFPPELEALVRRVHALDPRVFDDLQWAPFDWEKGRHHAPARALLAGLIAHHGDLAKRRELLAAYRAAVGDGSSG